MEHGIGRIAEKYPIRVSNNTSPSKSKLWGTMSLKTWTVSSECDILSWLPRAVSAAPRLERWRKVSNRHQAPPSLCNAKLWASQTWCFVSAVKSMTVASTPYLLWPMTAHDAGDGAVAQNNVYDAYYPMRNTFFCVGTGEKVQREKYFILKHKTLYSVSSIHVKELSTEVSSWFQDWEGESWISLSKQPRWISEYQGQWNSGSKYK